MSETLQNAIYCGPTCKFISVGILGQFAWHSYVAHLVDAAQQCAQEVTLPCVCTSTNDLSHSAWKPTFDRTASQCLLWITVIQLGAKRVHSFDHSDFTFNLWDYFQFNQNKLNYTNVKTTRYNTMNQLNKYR